ncbi:ABC transporter permease [Bradyrhizobium sp. U87765 SZCCT0131]|uniref:ABC transporter permease n=1 Tax=unclassified Bradyrhizobium TaxID=2631580 RepID=UPI001BAACCC2|nr:ABC transporter permease [Bradyrhizobium sp. U87765 SZCCT0131]MBR1264369.1 ABC transporter permease [Bradyrhizobium sp. U87765 SZCCT0134]MBR1304724.1 ABC transporter permease [Bradyrhizobium sp. U87765 SZCCT0110]MBR1322419.1 ABC transporter permease [Bradyrhizobium sp. U87765 SZCCT0109]MBR1346653.1 ABC transporter permease [Bradyrhizobium sp. U87765 SZCCT0048]
MTASWSADGAPIVTNRRSDGSDTGAIVAHLRASLGRGALGLTGLGLLLLAWWLGTDVLAPAGFIQRFSPSSTFHSLGLLATQSDLPVHLLVSLRRIAVGLALALVIGVPLGLAVGRSGWLNAATSPAFQFLRMISPLSWMPLAVMVFGVGDRPIYFLLTFAAVWPILLNTAEGVRRLEPSWLRLAASLSATRWETLRHVIVPGILGYILTGLRLSIGIVWIVLVPCEMLGVSAGLGYFILDTRDRLAYPELMAMVLIIGFLGFLLDGGARLLYRSVARGH